METVNLRLKDFFDIFIKSYTNPKTVEKMQISFKLISHLNTLDIPELIQKTIEITASLPIVNNTKNLYRSFIKIFLRWLSTQTKQYYNSKDVPLLQKDFNKRQAYTEREMSLLELELENFNKPKFTLTWKLLKYNGLRLSEFVNVDWKRLKLNNYQMQIRTAKNNNNRLFMIPPELIADFERYGVTANYNTIQDYFFKFRHFFQDKHPEFVKPIHAHMLRHYFVTKAAINLGSISKVQSLTGHLNPDVLISTYIKYNNFYQKIWLEQANQDTIEALDKQKLLNYIKISNHQIAYLKQKLIDNGVDHELPLENSQNLIHLN